MPAIVFSPDSNVTMSLDVIGDEVGENIVEDEVERKE